MKAQLERTDAERERIERVLLAEKEGRENDAVELGRMMARLSAAEEKERKAQRAFENLTAELDEERARRLALEAKLLPSRSNRPPRAERPESETANGDSRDLQSQLAAARAEAQRARDALAPLQKRAVAISAGLKEMRELMVESAALFDDLGERERAIAEIRAKSMHDARALFLRAAGRNEEDRVAPPPLPRERAAIEDLSEAAELLEEEVRASMRPPAHTSK
jgi:hypothetical protein